MGKRGPPESLDALGSGARVAKALAVRALARYAEVVAMPPPAFLFPDGFFAAVVFPDATLGITLELREDMDRVILRSAHAFSAAASVPYGMVLSAIDGSPVGSVFSREAYREITDRIRAAPRPITLEFVAPP